jgi:RNA polymerase sigma-70 factor, ECF subfamily
VGPLNLDAEAASRFDRFARAHRALLLATAIKLCGDRADASDLVQDTLERALVGFDRLRPDSDGRAWAMTILHNLFVDHCRKRSRLPRHERIDEVAVSVAAEEQERAARSWLDVTPDQLRAALAQLGDEARAVYQLHALDGKSYQETAEQLGISMITVGTRLHLARQKLRALLTAHSEPELAEAAQTG